MMSDEIKIQPDPNPAATRRRSIAIALLLVAMVVMFYAATIVRFGTNAAHQAM